MHRPPFGAGVSKLLLGPFNLLQSAGPGAGRKLSWLMVIDGSKFLCLSGLSALLDVFLSLI